jgi:4-alpha-glucanotransferase
MVQVREVKGPLLRKAADRLRLEPKFKDLQEQGAAFRQLNPWVEDSALFYALSHHEEELVGKAWWLWPEPVRCDGTPVHSQHLQLSYTSIPGCPAQGNLVVFK